MTQNDWRDAGEQIKNLVEDAVETGDFSRLGDTISDVVNDTMDGIQSVLKESLGNLQGRQEDAGTDGRFGGSYKEGAAGDREYARTNRDAAERIRRNMEQQRRAREEARSRQPVQINRHIPGEIGGRVMKYLGYAAGGMFGTLCLAVGAFGISIHFAAALGTSLMLGVLSGTGFAVGYKGSEKLRLGQRFRRYLDVLGDRTYCLIEDLAAAVGKSEKFVRKDLKRLIGQGYFREGYLDQKETLLITDHETWKQYKTMQAEYEKRRTAEQRQTAEAAAPETAGRSGAGSAGLDSAGHSGAGSTGPKVTDDELAAAKAKLSPEYRELISEGESYIRYIRECNDRLPGEEISAKLDRLELVVTRIFREAARNPESVSDLKKMMSYYLPTTRKLLEAYCEMEAQPIQGQNIETTKAEIETALNTLNQAFENLLDSLFEEKAWDISSDITVLNTMLAQEGLTGSDFKTKARKAESGEPGVDSQT